MHALVVFESMFGNTQKIAQAVSDGLVPHTKVDLVEVGSAPAVLDEDVTLLVVGGPTQAWGMTRKGTRQSAANQAPEGLVSKGIGLREWLATVKRGSKTVAAVAFDTRFQRPRWLTGSAARGVQNQLRRLGFRTVAPSESFFVSATTGPLVDGETERARRWAEKLGSRLETAERDRSAS
jgi:hypothetical protein